jgi:hypothetical protein
MPDATGLAGTSAMGPKPEVTLADARQKSDSNGLVGGPLCGFSFAERVLR